MASVTLNRGGPRLALWLSVAALGGVLGTAVVLLSAEHAIVLLSAGVALMSLVWMHQLISIFSVKRLTIAAAFYWMYFLRVYLPAHMIFLEGRGAAGWRYAVAVMAVLVLVPLGIGLGQVVFRRNRWDTRRFFVGGSWPAVPLKASSLWFFGLLALSVAVMLLHLRQLPTIPIVYLIRHPGQSAAIALLREGSGKTLAVSSWLLYLMAWTQNLFLPLLTMLCWGEYRVSRKRKWLVRGLVTLCLGLFYASVTVAKGPVAQFVLMLVLFYWLWSNAKITPKTVLVSVGLVLLFPFAVNFLRYGMQLTLADVSAVFSWLWQRLFYITADMPYHYFDLFPLYDGFLGGRTIGLLSNLMGWEYFNTSRYVFGMIVPGGLESGYANSAFIGDLYADFGMWGVLLGSILVGFLLQALQVYLEGQPRTTLLMAVYVFICVAATNLVGTSITITLMTGGIIVAVVILWFARYLGPVLVLGRLSSTQLPTSERLTGE